MEGQEESKIQKEIKPVEVERVRGEYAEGVNNECDRKNGDEIGVV